MIYISNYNEYINEGLSSRKLKNPHVIDIKTIVGVGEPIISGVVLILSNPIFNGKRRIYMGIIDRVMENKLPEAYGVTLTGEFYILKEHSGGKIMPEKILQLNAEKRMLILNMSSKGLYLNDNKTPLWQISTNLTKIQFFNTQQSLLKEITNMYSDVEIPFTHMKTQVYLQ